MTILDFCNSFISFIVHLPPFGVLGFSESLYLVEELMFMEFSISTPGSTRIHNIKRQGFSTGWVRNGGEIEKEEEEENTSDDIVT